MDNAGAVNILDSFEDRADEFRSIAGNRTEHTPRAVRGPLTLRNNSPSHISYQTAPRPCRDQRPDKGCALSGVHGDEKEVG